MADPTFEARLRALIRVLYSGTWQMERVCIPARSDVSVPHIMGRVPDIVEVGDVPTLYEWLGDEVAEGCKPFSHWFNNEQLDIVNLGAAVRRPEGAPLIQVVARNAAHIRVRNWTAVAQDVGVLVMARQGIVDEEDSSDVEGMVGVWLDFSGSPLIGTAPLTVGFTDLSTYTDQLYATAWDWNYGDGTPHGAVQNPSHAYALGGPYTVTLTITFSDGTTAVVTKANYVTAT